MAAGNFTFYDAMKTNLLEGKVNFSSDNFNLALVASSYTPSVPGDATWANASADEATGTGYTAGGVTLGSDALSYFVAAAAVAAGGTGYAASSTFNVNVSGGTETTAAVVNVTTNASGVVTTINSITTAGVYSVLPANPAATTGGAGSGLTLTLTWGVAITTAAAVWASSTITAKYALMVHRAGGSLVSTDLLVGYIDLNTGGGSISSTNGTFQVSPSAQGWATLT
ncbi:MAG: hypothetical protein ACREFV_12075 [Acetobacteraceae bacterium]